MLETRAYPQDSIKANTKTEERVIVGATENMFLWWYR